MYKYVQMCASFDLLKLIKTVFKCSSLPNLSEGDTKTDIVRVWFPNFFPNLSEGDTKTDLSEFGSQTCQFCPS
uniref:Secreted protein n=1 Tax=Panagrellus redivivus TaxID=6233 RepID=A0A7E4WAF7_PANRE